MKLMAVVDIIGKITVVSFKCSDGITPKLFFLFQFWETSTRRLFQACAAQIKVE